MAVTAEVIEYGEHYYVRCQQQEGLVYFIDEYYERTYTSDKLRSRGHFFDKDSATKVMEEYLDFVNTLGLSM